MIHLAGPLRWVPPDPATRRWSRVEQKKTPGLAGEEGGRGGERDAAKWTDVIRLNASVALRRQPASACPPPDQGPRRAVPASPASLIYPS